MYVWLKVTTINLKKDYYHIDYFFFKENNSNAWQEIWANTIKDRYQF